MQLILSFTSFISALITIWDKASSLLGSEGIRPLASLYQLKEKRRN
ncbi:hypothetical protein [Fusobacterium ulcerans]|nr:hypothetical protein [Fusobacterium ulcerans]